MTQRVNDLSEKEVRFLERCEAVTGEEYGRDRAALAVCRVCGAQVTVNARPAANGIDVGGQAVAVNCPAGGDS